MATALITAVESRDWEAVQRLVKEDKTYRDEGLQPFADLSLLDEPIPLKLAVTVNGKIVAHSEIRDLGTPGYGIRIAGLSNTVVTPGYRRLGIYTALIRVRNLLLDHSDFLFVAARVKRGYEGRYTGVYPGFVKVKEADPQDQAWLVRATRGKTYSEPMLGLATAHLEKVGRW
jgi:hypothetical protein